MKSKLIFERQDGSNLRITAYSDGDLEIRLSSEYEDVHFLYKEDVKELLKQLNEIYGDEE